MCVLVVDRLVSDAAVEMVTRGTGALQPLVALEATISDADDSARGERLVQVEHVLIVGRVDIGLVIWLDVAQCHALAPQDGHLAAGVDHPEPIRRLEERLPPELVAHHG